jgi:hypothetical protein
MKKVLSTLAVLLTLFILTGCGGGGGSNGGGVSKSDDPINDSVGGGDAQNKQAYNKLKGYYNMFDDSAYYIYQIGRGRGYHHVTSEDKTAFVNNLVNNKNFYIMTEMTTPPYYTQYSNSSALPLPGVRKARAVTQYRNAYGGYGYSIGTSLEIYDNNTVSNDALFNDAFGTVNGKLVSEGFDLYYHGDSTSDFTALINVIQASPYNFSLIAGNLTDGALYAKTEGGYTYMFYFLPHTINSIIGISYEQAATD